jgi:hypothetical protein
MLAGSGEFPKILRSQACKDEINRMKIPKRAILFFNMTPLDIKKSLPILA